MSSLNTLCKPKSLWRQIGQSNFRDIEKLLSFLELDELAKKKVLQRPNFPLNLPLRLAQKIKKNDLNDPIFKQFVPLQEELILNEAFLLDPVGDGACKSSSKLLHKYEGRVLLVTTSSCAMHCRYCFRQNFDYDKKSGFLFEEELALIAKDTSIKEVILSGGDPLSLSNEALALLIDKISEIKHIKRLRFHTRFPIGIPERIDEGFLAILNKCPLQVWFVLHINHPNELDEELFSYLDLLQKTGAILLNQSVLLKGVNDDADILIQLSEQLVDRGILPYYLHQLDRVVGSSHFEVSEKRGLQLIREISERLSGYGVPKYVREIAGEKSKTALN